MTYTKWREDWRDEADPSNPLPGATSIDAGFLDQVENTFVSQDARITTIENLPDAKGDIIASSAANVLARVPAGTTDGHVLTRHAASGTGMRWAAPVGGGSEATSLHRLVQSGSSYPARPSVGYVDFLGSLDPGVLLLAGDTWTQLPAGPSAPNAPTIGTATAGDASASVAFTPSGTGATATSFTATSTPGGFTGTGVSSPLTVSGLTNGTSYTFTVHATNATGNSAESAASNSVTPALSGTALTDTFTGSNGAAWSTAVWEAAPPDVTMDIQSNQGRVLFTSGGFSELFTRRFTPADSANWRVRFHLATPPAVSWRMRLYLQATDWPTGFALPNTGYFSYWDTNGFNVANIVGGSAAELYPFTTLSATNRWMDIKVVGGVLKFKAWTGTLGDEPGSFTTVNNPSPITGTGEAGVFWGAIDVAGTIDFRIDDVLIDTNPGA